MQKNKKEYATEKHNHTDESKKYYGNWKKSDHKKLNPL